MQTRHQDRSAYFEETATSCRNYYLPYIEQHTSLKFGRKCRVMEVGCGIGGILSIFAAMGATVTGIDIHKPKGTGSCMNKISKIWRNRKMNNKLEVIGIDHGWSMMKTVTQVFVTGVKEITTTPALFGDVLEYDGKYYKIGTVRQEVKDTKVEDDSFYLLTLAAVAKELKKRGLSDAKVFLAVGLPLTRFGAERNNFIKYLTKNKRVDFRYENEAYHIEIDDVAVFPQCYAAVVDKIPTMAKKTLVVDIGSWTIDIMPVINKSPDESKCVTVPRGLITCMRSINEQCVRQLNGEVDETEIQNIMRYGRSDIDDEYLAIIKAEIEDFVEKVYNSIREFSYNLKTTPIVFVGGGAVVMKNFSNHEAKNISYILDVKANARGYEQLAIMGLKTAKRLA